MMYMQQQQQGGGGAGGGGGGKRDREDAFSYHQQPKDMKGWRRDEHAIQGEWEDIFFKLLKEGRKERREKTRSLA